MTSRLGVVYDYGAASPMEITSSLSQFCTPVALLPPSDHATRMRAVFSALGVETHPIDVRPSLGHLALDGVVTFSELCIATASGLVEQLGLRGPDQATALLLTDKTAQRSRFAASGLDDMRFATVGDRDQLQRALEHVGTPVVVKPARGGASRFCAVAHDEREAASTAEAYWSAAPGRPMVIESYLPGLGEGLLDDYVSVEVLSQDGDHQVLALTGNFLMTAPFRERGHVWPPALDRGASKEVGDLAIRAVVEIGVVDGMSHVEVKLTPRGPRLIEVNGRIGGFVPELAMRAAGVDLIGLAGAAALGQAERPQVRIDRVTYARHVVAPMTAVRLLGRQGGSEVAGSRGVDAYRPLVRAPGTLVRDGSTQRLDHLSGTADSHADMVADVAAAHERLVYAFELADGSVEQATAGDWDRRLPPAGWIDLHAHPGPGGS